MGETLKLGCVVLAAGSARRFGGNKLTAALSGKSLIRRALEAVPTEVVDAAAVVTQYPEAASLAKEYGFTAIQNDRPALGISHSLQLGLAALGDCDGVLFQVADQPLLRRETVAGFTAIQNDRPALGISHSLQLGLAALGDCDGVLFQVADQPLLRRETVAGLATLWKRQPDCIAALGHGGVRGNPCLFPARLFPELMALEGDCGGSAVIRRHEADLVLLETDPAELYDVDTAAALELLRERLEP